MSKLDPYTLLVIFSNFDNVETLKSCSLVCRNWYKTFFAEKSQHSESKSSPEYWRRNLQPLYDSSFCKTLHKIFYINCMVNELDLKLQYSEWMGNSDLYSTIYERLENQLLANEFVYQNMIKKDKPFVEIFKKRYLTLSRYCSLIASIRNPLAGIRRISNVNRVPEMFKDNVSSACQFMVVTNKKASDCVSFYSSADDACLLKDFNIGKDVLEINSLALSYNPLMNSEYRKFLNIDPKLPDINIYSFYVLYTSNVGLVNLKKYLVCDTLEGELIVREQFHMLKDARVDCGPLVVSGWENFGMVDLVVITTKICLYLVTPKGIIHYFYTDHFNSNSIHQLDGTNLFTHCSLQASYLINFTKAVKTRGLSLIDSTKYSNYSVFTLQYGGSLGENNITSQYICLIIAQKKESFNNHDSEFSIFCNKCTELTKYVEPIRHDWQYMRDHIQTIQQYYNQGKEIIVQAVYFQVNEKGISDSEFFCGRHYEHYLSEKFDYYDEICEIIKIDLWDDRL